MGAAPIVLALLAIALGTGVAKAAESQGGAEPSQGGMPAQAASPTEGSEYEKHWYLSVGTSNHHPKLKESEAQIDEEVNGLFGLLPRWKNPTTFEDWADDFKLWDVAVGIGRDITPRTSWGVWMGGAGATIKTKARYGILDTDIRFSRASAFLTVQGYVYPWGKPELQDDSAIGLGQHMAASLKGTRPYGTLAAGYLFVRAKGDVRLDLPVVGRVFRQKQVENHHMRIISPKIGVEIPVSRDNTLTLEAAYNMVGPHHENEYDGASYFVGVKHRF
jgi:hypothetical protein